MATTNRTQDRQITGTKNQKKDQQLQERLLSGRLRSREVIQHFSSSKNPKPQEAHNVPPETHMNLIWSLFLFLFL